HQQPTVGSPGWSFVMPAIRNDPLTRTIRPHHADAKGAACLLCEGNQIAARTPDRRTVPSAAVADAMCVRAIRIHDIDLLRTAAIGFKHDLGAVRREAAAGVYGGIGREAAHRT